MTAAADRWERFQIGRVGGSFSRWPNEAMVKVLFGSYLGDPRPPAGSERVLDVGCGFGQNLLPFAAIGCAVAGVELTEAMAASARDALTERGVEADFRAGRNRSIPFPDASFDLVLSVNTIHYETSEADYRAAIAEFARVLTPGGRLYVSTVAPEHEIRARAESLGAQRFCIRDYDFRDGETMVFLDEQSQLADYLATSFARVETGRVTERLMTRTLDFYLALAVKAG